MKTIVLIAATCIAYINSLLMEKSLIQNKWYR